MYFFPFEDVKFDIGFGPDAFRRNFYSPDSLHMIAPTVSPRTFTGKSRSHFRYYWNLPQNGSDTFSKYTTSDHRIYVLGHGAAGTDVIYSVSRGQPRADQRCTALQLSDRLKAHGLPETSKAHIRIHACDSATRTDTALFGDDGVALQNPCFADKFWVELTKNKTHEDVTVRGYDQTMGPYIIARMGSGVFTGANAHHFDYFKNDNWTGVQPGKIPKNRTGG
jgi:hypothetical protein